MNPLKLMPAVVLIKADNSWGGIPSLRASDWTLKSGSRVSLRPACITYGKPMRVIECSCAAHGSINLPTINGRGAMLIRTRMYEIVMSPFDQVKIVNDW